MPNPGSGNPRSRQAAIGQFIILAFGDSITAGKCDEKGGGWPALFKAHLSVSHREAMIYNLGINGETCADISNRWQEERNRRIPGSLPSIHLFSFGLNDSTLVGDSVRLPLKDSVRVARQMLFDSRQIAPTFWIGPTPIDESRQPSLSATGEVITKSNGLISDYNKAYSNCAYNIQVPYLDLFSMLINDSDWHSNLADGIHPNHIGYKTICSKICSWSKLNETLRNF